MATTGLAAVVDGREAFLTLATATRPCARLQSRLRRCLAIVMEVSFQPLRGRSRVPINWEKIEAVHLEPPQSFGESSELLCVYRPFPIQHGSWVTHFAAPARGRNWHRAGVAARLGLTDRSLSVSGSRVNDARPDAVD